MEDTPKLSQHPSIKHSKQVKAGIENRHSKQKLDVISTGQGKVHGVSVSNYTGGYGEEMDIDFDGTLADSYTQKGNKKRDIFETEASKEYGNKEKKSKIGFQ